ncbi:MAG: hypothetical protein KF823_04380 [Xanthomonadales bacterium]|nr:hypothetical protein [Xanthomonadales bacterium]
MRGGPRAAPPARVGTETDDAGRKHRMRPAASWPTLVLTLLVPAMVDAGATRSRVDPVVTGPRRLRHLATDACDGRAPSRLSLGLALG